MKSNNEEKEQEKQQVVYMVPSQDMDEDEIDLWQLILPLVKYKLQILLFLLLGLAIGFGISWNNYRKTANATKETTPQLTGAAYYQDRLEKAQNEKQVLWDKLIESMDQINGSQQIMEIVSAEYRYGISGEGAEQQSISLNNFAGFDPRFADRTPENYQLFLTVKQSDIPIVVNRLKGDYEELSKLMEEVQKVKLSLTDFKSNWLKGKYDGNTTASDLNEILQRQELRSLPELKVLESKHRELSNNINKIMTEVEFALFSLSEQIEFESETNLMPISIWSDIAKQAHQGRRGRDRQEYQQVQATRSQSGLYINKIDEIGRIKSSFHFFDKAYDLPQQVYRLLNIELGNAKQGIPASGPRFNPANKLVLISLIIAFFLGVFSVYLRVLIINARKGQGFEKQKKEFIEALKFWKL